MCQGVSGLPYFLSFKISIVFSDSGVELSVLYDDVVDDNEEDDDEEDDCNNGIFSCSALVDRN